MIRDDEPLDDLLSPPKSRPLSAHAHSASAEDGAANKNFCLAAVSQFHVFYRMSDEAKSMFELMKNKSQSRGQSVKSFITGANQADYGGC